MHFGQATDSLKRCHTPPAADWDQMFSSGHWDYLDNIDEAPRYATIAGYIHRRTGQIAILDVGCGSGVLCRYLDQSRVSYLGIDLSPVAIRQAEERFSRATFVAVDIASYEPTPAQAFDCIVLNEVLPHVADPLGALDRYLGFLRPGGVAVLSTYQNPNPNSNAASFRPLLEEALRDRRFNVVTRSEVATFENDRKWSIDVISGDQGA